jgi:hypothetical protein
MPDGGQSLLGVRVFCSLPREQRGKSSHFLASRRVELNDSGDPKYHGTTKYQTARRDRQTDSPHLTDMSSARLYHTLKLLHEKFTVVPFVQLLIVSVMVVVPL